MNLLFELSKEHKTLPKSEIISCLKAENIPFEVDYSDEDAFIIDSDVSKNKIKTLSNRLSYTFFIDELLFSSINEINEIKKNAINKPIKMKGTIAIYYKNRSQSIDSKNIIKQIGEVYTHNRRVDLTNPDIKLRVLITEKKIHVGRNVGIIDRSQFEKRKVQHRPFFSPISLHPKLARALVNSSQIKKGEKLLDPFCGTGGILIEAGLVGSQIIGCDIEKKMIEGCKITLKHYGIKDFLLINEDIGDIKNHIKEVDAVVTDLPYGKSTTTKGEDVNLLYKRAFEIISKLLKKSGIAVVVSPKSNMSDFYNYNLTFLEKHEIKMHRSLTRYICLFQK
jgi:tRNA (guanine10-N2)-dimethyltransferase